MIKHHPKHELLSAFVDGQLAASLSAATAMHLELCPVCQKKVELITDTAATQHFSDGEQLLDQALLQDDGLFNRMIENITEDETPLVIAPVTSTLIEINGQTYNLPRALNSIPRQRWQTIGKLTRARLELNEEPLHSSLLKIEAGGSVPQHTHKGFELTFLLDGSFEDEVGTYHPGDFIWLDQVHTHTPATKHGCLCFTVSSDALKFTQGISQLLNPIGNLIY